MAGMWFPGLPCATCCLAVLPWLCPKPHLVSAPHWDHPADVPWGTRWMPLPSTGETTDIRQEPLVPHTRNKCLWSVKGLRWGNWSQSTNDRLHVLPWSISSWNNTLLRLCACLEQADTSATGRSRKCKRHPLVVQATACLPDSSRVEMKGGDMPLLSWYSAMLSLLQDHSMLT